MTPFAHYHWPFYEASDPPLAREIDQWARSRRDLLDPPGADHHAACRAIVRQLGQDGWLKPLAGPPRMRSLCIAREVLARHSDLADFCFAMQGLGSHAIAIAGSAWQRETFLVPVTEGRHVAGFALSEPEAGSDIGAVQLSARADGDDYVLDGTKSWISHAGLADHFIVIARTAGTTGPMGLSGFVVPASTRGLRSEPVELLSPRPFGTLHFDNCRIHGRHRIADEGAGARLALDTLSFYRPSVGAAALGIARRALEHALCWANTRRIHGKPLAEQQLTQHRLAQAAADLDAAALLVARAAWLADNGVPYEVEASLAKWQASERCQQVVDAAVQLLGARGVLADGPAGRAYREIRSLRIYEGTSEVLQLMVAQKLLRQNRAAARRAG